MRFKSKFILLSAAVLLVWFLSMPANAEDLQKKPYKIIKTDKLKTIWDAKPNDLLIVDARNPGEYADVHIPGAINIPQNKFDEYTHLLPAEKNTRIVFYCNGFK
jgi:3-mercaptopyruvate sulfurtransferase SseA